MMYVCTYKDRRLKGSQRIKAYVSSRAKEGIGVRDSKAGQAAHGEVSRSVWWAKATLPWSEVSQVKKLSLVIALSLVQAHFLM